jgi:hypothetical protein
MKRFLTLALTMMFAAQLFARLGNNEAQVEELYGKPVKTGAPDKLGVITNRYEKGDYIILIQFLRHLSIAESFTRTDQKDFSEDELNHFLEGRTYTSHAWIKDPDKLEWVRIDRHARAWCRRISGRPTFLIEVQ